MVVNAGGIPILLQAAPGQLQDLLGSLSAGTTLNGRVVELLPQNQALVSLRGQNVVAQLPAGSSLAKGDILSLLVSEVDSGDAATPASLVLKLMGSSGNANAAAAPSGSTANTGISASGFAQMEQALAAAKLPINSVNLSLVETLSKLGAPLDPQTLQSLSKSVESLISNELPSASQPASVLSEEAVRQALQEGLAQVKVAAQLSASSEQSVTLMQAARSLEEALQGNTEAGTATGSASASGPQQWSAQVEQALQALLDDPNPTQVANLNAVLGQAAGAEAAPTTTSVNASAGATAASNAALALNSADIPAMREALAQLLGPMNQNPSALTAGSLAESAQSLATALSGGSEGASQRLISAVQAQSPQSTAEGIQNAAGRALQQVADFYGQFPADRPLSGVATVQADLAAQGLPVPRADLATLPQASVAEAVAWLGARGLPAQRPLVETVAGWMAQDRSVLPAAQKALQAQGALGEDALEARPSLKQAYEALGQAMDAAGLDPESEGLAGQLQDWASAQGLTLESDLAGASALAQDSGQVSAAGHAQAASANSLRGSLLHLENELNSALQAAQPADSTAVEGLNAALRSAQAAVRGFNALPLQAQGAPAFDTVHLPMPVWMNGALGDGQLSVTWRQGRERGLDDKVPVNVAVSLNTESLGQVTVSLQVWKDAAGARVLAQDKETAAFLAQGADDLREGFSENTPFELRALDFVTASASPKAEVAGYEVPPGGLSLRA